MSRARQSVRLIFLLVTDSQACEPDMVDFPLPARLVYQSGIILSMAPQLHDPLAHMAVPGSRLFAGPLPVAFITMRC